MKKMKFILLLALIVLLNSCEKLDKYTQFDLNFTQQTTIQSSTPINLPFNLPTPSVTTNSEQTFKSNNTNKNLVDKIELTKLQITVLSPSGEDFSILKSIEIYINSPGLPETKIAWLNAVPTSQSIILLDLSGADLKDYIFADSFTLNVKTVTDELNTHDYKIEIKTTFNVNARILGI